MKIGTKIFVFLGALGLAALIGGVDGDKTFMCCYIGVILCICVLKIVASSILTIQSKDRKYLKEAIAYTSITLVFYLGLGLLISFGLYKLVPMLPWNIPPMSFYFIFKLLMLCEIPF